MDLQKLRKQALNTAQASPPYNVLHMTCKEVIGLLDVVEAAQVYVSAMVDPTGVDRGNKEAWGHLLTTLGALAAL